MNWTLVICKLMRLFWLVSCKSWYMLLVCTLSFSFCIQNLKRSHPHMSISCLTSNLPNQSKLNLHSRALRAWKRKSTCMDLIALHLLILISNKIYQPWMDIKVGLEVLIKLLSLACLLRNNFVELRYKGAKERHCREEQKYAEDLSSSHHTAQKSAQPQNM